MSGEPARLGAEGFEFVEFSGPEPDALARLFDTLGFVAAARHRSKDVVRYRQGDINLLLNREPIGQPAQFRNIHGAAANAIALRVENAAAAFARAVKRGATPVRGRVGAMELNIPAIAGIGGLNVYLVDRAGAASIYDVDFIPIEGASGSGPGVGLTHIDHVSHIVERGTVELWAKFYEDAFGFHAARFADIEGETAGPLAKAMSSPGGQIRISLRESPDDASQLAAFVRRFNGGGIQHIALGTHNLAHTVERLRAHGAPIQDTAERGADALGRRGADDAAERAALRHTFTEEVIGPVFFEIIQRADADARRDAGAPTPMDAIAFDAERRGAV